MTISVRVTPRASRDMVEGQVDTGDGRQALAVRVRAAPSDGAANEAVVRALATALGVPVRAVSLVAGGGARLKQVRVTGPTEAIMTRLEEIAEGGRT